MICRLCLISLNSENSVFLFDAYGGEGEKLLLKMIAKYLHLEITSQDEISTTICQECSNHLTAFHKYCDYVEQQQSALSNKFLVVEYDNHFSANDVRSELQDPMEVQLKCEPEDEFLEETAAEMRDANDKISYPSNPSGSSSKSETRRESNDAFHFQIPNTVNGMSASTKDILPENSLLKMKKYQISNEDDILESQNKILKELLEIKQRLRGHEVQIEHVGNQNDTILTTFKQIVRKNFNIDEKLQFPIKCEEKLGEIDSIISQNKEKYVNIIQNIITPTGLYHNFDKLVSNDLILLMNYDGVNGKHSFKQYQALNHAIFDAMKTDGFTEKEYVKNIRLCFKNYKNRHFRKVSFEKKNQKAQVLEACTS